VEIERLAAEAKCEDKYRGSAFNDDTEEDVARHHVRKKESGRNDHRNEEGYKQQYDDHRAPRQSE